MLRITFITILFLLLNIDAVFSQYTYNENENIGVHPRLGGIYNVYSADMTGFQGAADCGLLETASGFGFSGGVAIEKPILNNKHHFSFGVNFIDRSGAFSNNLSFSSRDTVNGGITTVNTEHELAANLSYLEFQPDFRFTLMDNVLRGPLRLAGGLRVGIPIGATFVQKETIVSPEGAVFLNRGSGRSEERTIAEDDIRTINDYNLGFSLAVENLTSIGNNNFLSQQLVFDYNFSDVVSDASWNTYAVRLEFGIRFSVDKQEEEPEEEFEIITPEPEPEPVVVIEKQPELPPMPYAKTEIEEVDIVNVETGDELLSTTPLVYSVFFGLNSSKIPDAYTEDKNRNYPQDLFNLDPIEANYDVLHIIKSIYQRNPNAEFTLVAASSGSEYEENIQKLTQNRAKVVKDELIKLGVPEDKIDIKTRELPQYPSNSDFEEGRAENRRVDIQIKNAPIQEYVSFQKYSEIEGVITLNTDFAHSDSKLSLETNVDKFVYEYDEPGEYEIPFKVRMNQLPEEDYIVKVNVKYDSLSQVIEYPVSTNNIKIENINQNLENFQAILTFDYNSSQLSQINQDLLEQLSERLPEGSTIQILGSADALGSAERNIELENERAENTMNYIKSVSGDKFRFKTGRSSFKFNEDTPQGRMLNRSIRIRVEK